VTRILSVMAWSIKGDVKENTSPSTGRENLFLTSSPCPLCEALGSTLLPCGRWALFHLRRFIFY
jgi:hypothetical protein